MVLMDVLLISYYTVPSSTIPHENMLEMQAGNVGEACLAPTN